MSIKIKGIIFLLLLIIPVFYLRATQTQIVSQEIRYLSDEAREVYMVWGIDNWQVPKNPLPVGSFLKDNLVYTPLSNANGEFYAVLQVPKNSTVDYVFWITKGLMDRGTDVWDTNLPPQKDYHTKVLDDNIVVVRSKIKARSMDNLTILDFSFTVLIIAICFLILILLLQKFFWKKTHAKPAHLITASAISSLIFLCMIRPSVVGLSWDLYVDPFLNLSSALYSAFYDFVFLTVVTIIFYFLLYLLRNFRKVQWTISFLFITIMSFVIVFSLLNIQIVQMLGKPFNYQWLYYSDFLKSTDSRAALSANVSFDYIRRILLVLLSFILISVAMYQLIASIVLNIIQRRIIAVCFLLLISGYILIANKLIQEKNWPYEKLANPVTAFLESVNPFAASPALFTMEVNDSLKVFKDPTIKLNAISKDLRDNKIKNVLLFVLESTPAEYIQVYNRQYNITPNIDKYKNQSVIFKNIYAHAPATNLSMVSILGSIYPWLSYNSLTAEHPDLPFPTITSELEKKGYRTAFFNSADNRFQKAGEFLKHRLFDSISDFSHNTCNDKTFTLNSDWEFMDGKDDECTSNELVSWITKDTAQPFFGMMWTYQTHYPYFFNDQENHYADDPSLNKYLNALHHSDKILGDLLLSLEKNKLSESTLVVVLGDHGEAFGRHDQISHGRKIYEENLHVPCIFINPIFNGQSVDRIGGLVDVAPTIFNIIGYRAISQWQGNNLLNENKFARAYFFAPWSDYLFGYREGNLKFIFNATRNTTEVYDIDNDPYEQNDISSDHAASLPLAHQRLAGWTQYVNSNISKLIDKR